MALNQIIEQGQLIDNLINDRPKGATFPYTMPEDHEAEIDATIASGGKTLGLPLLGRRPAPVFWLLSRHG